MPRHHSDQQRMQSCRRGRIEKVKKKKGFVSFWTVTVAILMALVVWRVVIVWQFNRATQDTSATAIGAEQRVGARSPGNFASPLRLPGARGATHPSRTVAFTDSNNENSHPWSLALGRIRRT